MNLYNQTLSFVMIVSLCVGCSQKTSLEWVSFQWESDTISGKYIEKAYLYVPVKIDDLPQLFSMQLDLGTYDSEFYGNSMDPYLKKYASLANKLGPDGKFRNVNLRMGLVELKDIDIVYNQNFGEEISEDSMHSETPKHIGTIAPDMFLDKILLIDYKSDKLAICDSLPKEYESLPAVRFELTDGIMKLPFRINNKECQIMFDTGASPFQLVTTKERALEISDSILVDTLKGPLWWDREITIKGLTTNKPIEFAGVIRENSLVYYVEDGLWDGIYNTLNVWGLTGNAYFLDNMVIIDYKNQLFRVK